MVKVEIAKQTTAKKGAKSTKAGESAAELDTTPRITEITSTSSDDDEYVEEDDFDINESLVERVLALRDAIPPQLRDKVANSAQTVTSWTRAAAALGGKGLWVVTSSSLLLGIPLALCILSEQQLNEMSKSLDTNVLA